MNLDIPLLWISLPRREDRRAAFIERNVNTHPELRWIEVPGYDPLWHHFSSLDASESDGHAGCWFSGYAAIQIARALGGRGACIFEDDAKFDLAALVALQRISNSIDDHLVFLGFGTVATWIPSALYDPIIAFCQKRSMHWDHQLMENAPCLILEPILVEQLSYTTAGTETHVDTWRDRGRINRPHSAWPTRNPIKFTLDTPDPARCPSGH